MNHWTPAPRHHTVQEAARELGIGSVRLYRWLRQQRVLDAGNRPYQHFIDQGLVRAETSHWNHPYLGTRYYTKPVITPRGISWLRNRLKETEAV